MKQIPEIEIMNDQKGWDSEGKQSKKMKIITLMNVIM